MVKFYALQIKMGRIKLEDVSETLERESKRSIAVAPERVLF